MGSGAPVGQHPVVLDPGVLLGDRVKRTGPDRRVGRPGAKIRGVVASERDQDGPFGRSAVGQPLADAPNAGSGVGFEIFGKGTGNGKRIKRV